MKPISKSKRQLAQLLIEAGVTQFPEGTNWVAQDRDKNVDFFGNKPKRTGRFWVGGYDPDDRVSLPTLIPSWHQTVLSRDEFDHIVAETVVVSEPKAPSEKTKAALAEAADPAPTLDQLLQDWRNANDYAQRKQTEADEAAAMRDERWQAVQARAGGMGVTVGRCQSVVDESEWEVCDRCVVLDSSGDIAWEGRECTLMRIDETDKHLPYRVQDEEGGTYWVHSIRRP